MSCQEESVAPPTIAVDLGVPFEITYGQEAQLRNDNLLLKFSDILEDSRCPIDVQCFWEGRLNVSISANTQEIELSIGGQSLPSQIFESYKFTLQRAKSPTPVSDKTSSKPEYTVTLLVEKV